MEEMVQKTREIMNVLETGDVTMEARMEMEDTMDALLEELDLAVAVQMQVQVHVPILEILTHL
jgi:hypothetical protein